MISIEGYRYSNPTSLYNKYQINFKNNSNKTTVDKKKNLEKDLSAQKTANKNNNKPLTLRNTVVGALVGFAIGESYVIINRKINKPSLAKVAENFSKIFGREISEAEAKILAKKYKNIYKINKTTKFITELNEQVKKDFGYENTDISLIMNGIKGSFNSGEGTINIYPGNSTFFKRLKYLNKKNIFSTMIHEYTHVKQAEIAYRTDPAAYNNAMTTSLFNNLYEVRHSKLKQNVEQYARRNNISIEEAKKIFLEKKISDSTGEHLLWMNSVWKDLESFTPNKPEYQKGIDYIDAIKNYARSNDNYDKYKENLLEIEARKAGDLADEIFNFISPVIR